MPYLLRFVPISLYIPIECVHVCVNKYAAFAAAVLSHQCFIIFIYLCLSTILFNLSRIKKGMEPNWRHIIPPGHENVISEGHCIDECTRSSFPPQGISIFAVIMQTQNIGKEVKLRQVCLRRDLFFVHTFSPSPKFYLCVCLFDWGFSWLNVYAVWCSVYM